MRKIRPPNTVRTIPVVRGTRVSPPDRSAIREMKQPEIAAPAPMMRMLLLLSVPASSAAGAYAFYAAGIGTMTREPESL